MYEYMYESKGKKDKATMECSGRLTTKERGQNKIERQHNPSDQALEGSM